MSERYFLWMDRMWSSDKDAPENIQIKDSVLDYDYVLRYNGKLKQIYFAKIVDKLNDHYKLAEARELKIIKLKEEIQKLKKENHILKGKYKQQTKELAYLYEKYDVW